MCGTRSRSKAPSSTPRPRNYGDAKGVEKCGIGLKMTFVLSKCARTPLVADFAFLPREHMRGRSWESYFCPSVRLSHAWIVTQLNDALRIF